MNLINSMTFVLYVQRLMASGKRGRPRAGLAPEDPTDFMGTLREMAYVMRKQAMVAHQIMDQFGRQPKESHGGNPNGLEVDLEYLKFAEFWKANPLSFRGAFNPNKAEEQIKAKEKVFSVLAYTEYHKVAFSTYMLEADAKFWQNGVEIAGRFPDQCYLGSVQRGILSEVLPCFYLEC